MYICQFFIAFYNIHNMQVFLCFHYNMKYYFTFVPYFSCIHIHFYLFVAMSNIEKFPSEDSSSYSGHSSHNDSLTQNAPPITLPEAPAANVAFDLNSSFEVICSSCKEKLNPDSVHYVPVRQQLKPWLKSSFEGIEILAEFEKTGHLSSQTESELVKLLIKREMEIVFREKAVWLDNPLKKLKYVFCLCVKKDFDEHFNSFTIVMYLAFPAFLPRF